MSSATTAANAANLVTVSIGMVANSGLVWAILAQPPASRLTRVLTLWQFIADAATCLFGFFATLVNQLATPTTYDTNNSAWAWFTCLVWRSQIAPFFFVYFASQNLICLGLDRYWAICCPLTYSKNHIRCLMLCGAFNLLGCVELIVTLAPYYTVVNGTVCVSQPSGLVLRLTPIIWFGYNYMCISLALLGIYLRIGYEIWKRYRNRRLLAPTRQTQARDTVMSSLEREMIKLAVAMVAMSLLFCFSFAVGRVGLFLNSLGLVDYKFGSTKQLVGALLATAYSAVSPLVYMATLASYRRRVMHLLTAICRGCKTKMEEFSDSMCRLTLNMTTFTRSVSSRMASEEQQSKENVPH